MKGGIFFIVTHYDDSIRALASRLPLTHVLTPKITDEIHRTEAGLYGERYVANLLQEQGILMLQDCTIDHHQMDVLAIRESGCTVIEVKNIKGKVRLTEVPRQLLRTNEDGVVNIFTSPVVQLENSIRALQRFFLKHKIELPIYGAIAFPFHSAEISAPNSPYPVVVGKDLLNFLNSQPKIPTKLTSRQLQSVAKQIKHASRPFNRYPLCARFKIHSDEILSGCRCSNCGTFGLERRLRSWHCRECHHSNSDAHKQALHEYACIISDQISIREAMKFLHVDCRFVAKRLLESNSVKRTGNTHQSKYTLKR